MSRPDFAEIYLRLAVELSARSTCQRLSVGTVITSYDHRHVFAVGYNGNASNLPNHCDSDTPGRCGCFTPSTPVTARGVQRAYRRRYVGPMCRVITGDGELTLTPNHPVLTQERGWVAAHTLAQGEHLLGTLRKKGAPGRHPHDYDGAPLEEVFESLRVAHGMVRRSGRDHDFHGDGTLDEQVDIVGPHGGLPTHRQTPLGQAGEELILPGSDKETPLFGRGSAPLQALATRATLSGGPGRSSLLQGGAGLLQPEENSGAAYPKAPSQGEDRLPGQVPLDELLRRQEDHLSALVGAEVLGALAQDTALPEAALHHGMRDAHCRSEVHDLLSSKVSLHKVLHVERYPWSGHVFNLQTEAGWYAAGARGIASQNCLHSEANAIINCTAPRNEPKWVYMTHSPCVMCAKMFINLGGVVGISYLQRYRDTSGLEVLDMARLAHDQKSIKESMLAHLIHKHVYFRTTKAPYEGKLLAADSLYVQLRLRDGKTAAIPLKDIDGPVLEVNENPPPSGP